MLQSGGTAVVPAEGVYGLTCVASRPDAIARLIQLKGRDTSKPMLVLAPDWRSARALASEVPDALSGLEGSRLAATILLPARDDVPFGLVGPERLVGVRLPVDALGRALTDHVGLVVSTSANRSGEPTPRMLSDVPDTIRQRVDTVVDGGALGGLPSTVARWSPGRLTVLREGAVDRDALRAATGLTVE